MVKGLCLVCNNKWTLGDDIRGSDKWESQCCCFLSCGVRRIIQRDIYINISTKSRQSTDFRTLHRLLFLCIHSSHPKVQPLLLPLRKSVAGLLIQSSLRRVLDHPETVKPSDDTKLKEASESESQRPYCGLVYWGVAAT